MPTVCSNGIELAYEARGEGEPLVLVSGIGMQMVVWPEGFVGGLVARGFRVVVFDNRDVGMSTKLAALGVPPVRRLLARRILGLSVAAPYTLFDMASDVAGLLDALGIERAHVVGASLGGMVAQAMAIAHGGRMKSLVSMMSHPNRRLLTAGLPHATLRLLKHPGRTRAEVVANQVAFFRTAGSTRFDRDERALAERLGRAYPAPTAGVRRPQPRPAGLRPPARRGPGHRRSDGPPGRRPGADARAPRLGRPHLPARGGARDGGRGPGRPAQDRRGLGSRPGRGGLAGPRRRHRVVRRSQPRLIRWSRR